MLKTKANNSVRPIIFNKKIFKGYNFNSLKIESVDIRIYDFFPVIFQKLARV